MYFPSPPDLPHVLIDLRFQWIKKKEHVVSVHSTLCETCFPALCAAKWHLFEALFKILFLLGPLCVTQWNPSNAQSRLFPPNLPMLQFTNKIHNKKSNFLQFYRWFSHLFCQVIEEAPPPRRLEIMFCQLKRIALLKRTVGTTAPGWTHSGVQPSCRTQNTTIESESK